MTADISESLERIRKTAETLNNHADWIDAAVADTEKALVKSGVGVGAAVGFTGGLGSQRGLRYARVDGKFQIAIDSIPWSQCRRDEKLLAFQVLPKLLRRIKSIAGGELAIVNEKRPATREIVNSLPKTTDPPKPDTAALLEAAEEVCGAAIRVVWNKPPDFPPHAELREYINQWQHLKGQA